MTWRHRIRVALLVDDAPLGHVFRCRLDILLAVWGGATLLVGASLLVCLLGG